MTTTTPGGSIKLMFGGNGHSRGANVDGSGNAGKVAVYWKGGPEKEIEDIKEFTQENKLKEIGFAEEAFVYPPDDENVKTSAEGMLDKGNWMTVDMPKDMEKGRHMMVWVWEYGGSPQWSTCFDVMIK
jgi:trans-aconitate methyltransferase